MNAFRFPIKTFLASSAILTLTLVCLFPVYAKTQLTFVQLNQDKEKTLQKYKHDWSDKNITHASSSSPEYQSGEQVATITIPKMDLYEYPVYYGSDLVNNNWQITAPGHLGNWSMFGEKGVTCVGAHNYQLFKDLKVLKPKDKILIETSEGRYVYVVDKIGIYQHETDDWNKFATQHKAEYALNLMTCYPFDAIKTKDMYIVYTTLQKGVVYDS